MNHQRSKLKTLFTKGWKSKSVWLGYVVVALSGIQETLNQWGAIIPAKVYGIILAIIGSLIVIARTVTKNALEDK